MSALTLATLGVQCAGNRAVSMATLGVFCGDVVIIEQTRGGSRRRRRRVLHLGQPKLTDLFFFETSDEIKELVAEGKATLDGNEISIAHNHFDVPIIGLNQSAPQLDAIHDEVEKEIAQLVRTRETVRYNARVDELQEDIRKFEEELLVFLIAMDEC